jgi:hypothetical protein
VYPTEPQYPITVLADPVYPAPVDPVYPKSPVLTNPTAKLCELLGIELPLTYVTDIE